MNTSPLYRLAEQYAQEKRLPLTAAALPLACGVMTEGYRGMNRRFAADDSYPAYFAHALAVCGMLIDLHLPLPPAEEDVLLAAAVCHVLPETLRFDDLHTALAEEYGLGEEVYAVIRLIFREDDTANQQQFFEQIQYHPLALLIKLADRGNLVEQLYGISGWSARNYIYETKTYFMPLCVYGKEHYPALLAPISVLMEKMRTLTEVSEILLGRYEERETALSQQILALREDNATLKRMIAALRADAAG